MATIEKYCAPGVYDGRRMDFRLVRDEFFGLRGPASTMVEVDSLSHPDYLIEIEAVAGL
jgi:enamine deaminase RidA (YjgF/YER057c/UK114 family)